MSPSVIVGEVVLLRAGSIALAKVPLYIALCKQWSYKTIYYKHDLYATKFISEYNQTLLLSARLATSPLNILISESDFCSSAYRSAESCVCLYIYMYIHVYHMKPVLHIRLIFIIYK